MKIQGRNKISPSFNMSSMTDIVFLLLIFFVITSTLVTVSAIDVPLPKSQRKTESKGNVSITITENSIYYIDKTAVPFENLESQLKSLFSENTNSVLVIRGAETTNYKNVMKVIDIAVRNKMKMILAVKSK